MSKYSKILGNTHPKRNKETMERPKTIEIALKTINVHCVSFTAVDTFN